MNMSKTKIVLLNCLILLQACSSNTKPSVAPVPVEDRTVENVKTERATTSVEQATEEYDVIEARTQIKKHRAQNQEKMPMVLALLDEAEAKMQSGDHATAAVTLERALRLEPKNAKLWHRLATIRLQQKNWQQAINLAKKSNSLAAGDYLLQSDNWNLIAKANFSAGHVDAAKEARARAEKLIKK